MLRKALPPDFKDTVFMFFSSLLWLHFRIDFLVLLAVVCARSCVRACVCARTRAHKVYELVGFANQAGDRVITFE